MQGYDLLAVVPSPLVLLEPGTGQVLFANHAALALVGADVPLRAEAARGERLRDVRVDWQVPTGPRTLSVSTETVRPAGGDAVAVVGFEDITELEWARARSSAITEVAALLAGSLDYDETLEVIARLAVPRIADWCFVELLQADGSIARAAMEAANPELLASARELDRRYPLDPASPVGSPQVIRTGEPDLQPEISEAMLEAVAEDEEHLEMLRTLGFRSSLTVPLRARGQVIGDLALFIASSGRRFGEADLTAAEQLAAAGGLYLENARLYRDLALARDELEAILGGVADAVTVQGPDGRLVYVNEAAVRLLGFQSRAALLSASPAELIASFEMLDDDGQPFPLDRLPGRLALLGLEPEPVTVRYRAHGSGQIRWSRVKARPMRTADGGRLAINLIEDITDLKQAEETQRLLAEAGRVLAGSLDFEETLRRVAWLAVPELADWCMVDLVGERGLQRVAAAHADPARAATAEAMQGLVIDPAAPIGVAAVARTGRSELHTEVAPDHIERAAFNPHHAELLRQIGIRSQTSVPMTMRGQRLGVITLATTTYSERRLGPDQVAVAEELGRRAAVAVDSARLYRQRSAIARTLQESLLPPHLPEIAGLETAALYRAAGEGTEVGGDFYDLFSVADDQWIAVIGDVCGKGAEAAAVTALARYTIRTAAVRRRSPAAILRWLNDAMLRHDRSGRFCTITCVHLDLAPLAIRATVACGGHPPALLLRGGDGTVLEIGRPGTLLGLLPDPTLQDARAELVGGDALVLFTDGITEARAPERVLEPGDLRAALGAARGQPAKRIVEQLGALAMGKEGTPPRDDLAVLALRAKG